MDPVGLGASSSGAIPLPFPGGGTLVREGVGRVGLRNLLLWRVYVWEWPRDILPCDLDSRAGVASLLAEPVRTAPQSCHSQTCPRTLGLIAGSSPRGCGGEGCDSLKARLTLLPFSGKCGKVLHGICKYCSYSSEFFSKGKDGCKIQ